MSTASSTPNHDQVAGQQVTGQQVTGPRRLATETKASFKTTELIVYVLAVIGVFIAALVTDKPDDGQGFDAAHAWLYVTLLTIGYMVSRGLAKSGSREHYDA